MPFGISYHYGTRHWKTEVVASSVEMLSGRRKRDYEADSEAAQSAADATAQSAGISPNEAAEVGVMTMADTPSDDTDEDATAEDEALVLA